MSIAIETQVDSFPLERPRLRGRYRESIAAALLVPYFIAGNENRLATHICQTNDSIFQMANPLLLIGPVGVGKTAIALHVATKESLRYPNVEFSVRYLPAVDFARSYAEAVDSDDLLQFQSDIDSVPVLVIDDLQLIAGKSTAQDELASRIDSRCTKGLPTILTCRRIPGEVKGLRAGLVSRTLPGLTVPLHPPEQDARRMLLSELVIKQGLELTDDALATLNDLLPPNASIRVMDAAIKQLDLWCRMNESDPTGAAIRDAIDSSCQTDRLAISNIAKAVARCSGLKTADLRSKSRKKSVVQARSLSMYLSRKLTQRSLNQIGEYFGGRDHSTVLHSIRKIESCIDTDPAVSQIARDVKDKLNVT